MNVYRIASFVHRGRTSGDQHRRGAEQRCGAAAAAARWRSRASKYSTRGPVHEAFAETVTFDPQAGIGRSQSAAGPHRGTAAGAAPGRRTMSPGFPATGLGTTSAAIFCGSAAFGGRYHQAGSGFPVTGAVRKGRPMDIGLLGRRAMPSEVEYLPEPPASDGNRS